MNTCRSARIERDLLTPIARPAERQEYGSFMSHAPARQFTASDGIEIAYFSWGRESDEVPVVLHHGFAASAQSNWVAPGVVGALVDAGRQVVAVDARGHGFSDKPHDAASYGEQRMARDLVSLFDILDRPDIDLVGYSMGAIVALIAASFDTRIQRLVVGGVGAGVAELGRVERRHLDTDALAVGLRADDPASIADPVVRQFRKFADRQGADRFALAAQSEARNTSPIALDQITAPTLLIVGDEDQLAQRPDVLVAAIQGATLMTVAGDHLSAVANPDFARAIVDFLS